MPTYVRRAPPVPRRGTSGGRPMNLGKKLSLGAMTIGLSLGALTLGAAGCGSSKAETKGEAASCGAGSCGAEHKDANKEGGTASCGAEKPADPAPAPEGTPAPQPQ